MNCQEIKSTDKLKRGDVFLERNCSLVLVCKDFSITVVNHRRFYYDSKYFMENRKFFIHSDTAYRKVQK